jgi:hypothetical protein
MLHLEGSSPRHLVASRASLLPRTRRRSGAARAAATAGARRSRARGRGGGGLPLLPRCASEGRRGSAPLRAASDRARSASAGSSPTVADRVSLPTARRGDRRAVYLSSASSNPDVTDSTTDSPASKRGRSSFPRATRCTAVLGRVGTGSRRSQELSSAVCARGRWWRSQRGTAPASVGRRTRVECLLDDDRGREVGGGTVWEHDVALDDVRPWGQRVREVNKAVGDGQPLPF